MTDAQIARLVSALVQYQKNFGTLSNSDAQWVIKNPAAAITLFVKAVAGRKDGAPKEDSIEGVTDGRRALEFVHSLTLSCKYPFVARDHFVRRPPKLFALEKEPIIFQMSEDFQTWFLPKVEQSGPKDPIGMYRRSLDSCLFSEKELHDKLVAELGDPERRESSLSELWSLLKLASNGAAGTINRESRSMAILWIRDCQGNLRTVTVTPYYDSFEEFWREGRYQGWALDAKGFDSCYILNDQRCFSHVAT